jgi:hypothetical protein
MPKGQRHSAEFKFRVAVVELKGDKTLSKLASESHSLICERADPRGRGRAPTVA